MPDPATSILAEGAEVMARRAGSEKGVMIWPEDNDIVFVPQGSTLRVVEDPGPEGDPERSIIVYAPAKDVAGEVGRGDVRPLNPGATPGPAGR